MIKKVGENRMTTNRMDASKMRRSTRRPASKGISLPVEMIVIIAVAVLVLVVLAAFFAGGFGGGTNTIANRAALDRGCGIWKMRGCAVDGTDFDISGYLDAKGVQQQMDDACTANSLDVSGSEAGSCWNYCCGTGQPSSGGP